MHTLTQRSLLVSAGIAICCALLAGCAATRPSTRDVAGDATLRSLAVPAGFEEGDEVRIGAWNMYYLGMPSKRSGRATPDLEDLADYIMEAQVSVLALSEIAWHDTVDGRKGNWQLHRLTALLTERTGNGWDYRLFEQRSGSNQFCGVLWDGTRLQLLQEPVPVSIESPVTTVADSEQTKVPVWDRLPYAAAFSCGEGLTDFVVIPVHMKANVASTGGKAPPWVRRKAEAEEITRQLPGLIDDLGGDLDVILIGDTNFLHDEVAATVLCSWCYSGDEPFFRELCGEGATFVGGDESFDRAYVPAAQPEFADSGVEVLGLGFMRDRGLLDVPDEVGTKNVRRIKGRYSDHWMIVMTLTVGADDDHRVDGE